MPPLVGYKSRKISYTLPKKRHHSRKVLLEFVKKMLFFQAPRKEEASRGKPPTTPRMGIAKRSKAKPGKRKNYIFKGPLTSFLTNNMSCFSIAAFPMDAALERRRQCWRSISATKPAGLNQQE